MSIGKIREFNVKTGSWQSYVERLDMYLQANGIKEELKMPTLISLMGDEAYELLMNLASPKKPAELTYIAAKDMLRNHLQPTPSLLAERYRFRQRRQKGDESAGDYVAELKKLARNCKFKENLEENLRDQFVCGLKSDVIRQRLFAEDDSLTYVKAVKLAISLEAAERDAAVVEDKSQQGSTGSVDVHALTAREGRSGRARLARGGSAGAGARHGDSQHSEPRGNCASCGATGHAVGDCRFRDYVCSRCKRPGHLRRVCPNERVTGAKGARPGGRGRSFHYGQAADEEAETEEDSGDEVYLHQLCLRDYKAVSLAIKIDNKVIPMEVDTGTPISCISKSTYDSHFKHIKIQAHKLCLTFYDGSKIRPLGFIKPTVKYQDRTKELELFVIEGGTTSLLGRQWLTELEIAIPTLECFNITDSKNVHINEEICILLDRYKQLFDGSLGRFTGGQATLRVRPGAAPVFHRARPLPFALRERVDAELDAMLCAGIIEPVDCSDWASPLVPVNKSDGTLRICVDYKESRSACGGGGGSEGSDGRASWRVTLDHDLVETLSAIYPEWFKPQHRRERAASPASPPSPRTPCTPPSDDTFSSSGAEEMAGRQAGSSGASEPPSSPRVSPPKVIVDDSPLQPAMGKHKESLKVKLMMRRPINQLVAQGIMPPLKTPPAYFEQCKQLERAKTGDLLKAKIQRRPDRQELERRHILEQESHVDPSLAEKQRMLKKARLADQLNDQLSHRPGPLELIKKNILHTEEDIETAVKSGSLAFKATCEGASGRPEHPVAYCDPPEEVSPSPSPPSTLSPASAGVASPRDQPRDQHPAPGKTKPPKKSKCKAHHQPKARFKFHEYKGPPNALKASSPPDDTETPYELLLQQQQLLLQLMLPASPAPSSASVASDSSEYAPPPPPPPPSSLPAARIEDMKVSDLRAECKRRNLRVSGPKPTLIDRLRPFLVLDRAPAEDAPRSPASVASNASVASPEPTLKIEYEPAEDIVQSQRRQIEELERKLEASRQQLEAVRRDAAGAAASDQSRRLLQAHLCVTQLRAQLDALQHAPHHQPPAPRLVLAAAPPAAPDRLVRLFTVAPPAAPPSHPAPDHPSQKPTNPSYILNGVKVVPIAILPSAHYEPERAPPPPPPPPPPMPELSMPTPGRDSSEDSQIMDDVLEILVENGELPPSAVRSAAADSGYSEADAFSPADVLSPRAALSPGAGAGGLGGARAADDLQRELDDIQNEIMSHADMHASGRAHPHHAHPAAPDLDADLSVDLLSDGDFHADFGPTATAADNDDFFERFFSGEGDRIDDSPPLAMDIGEDAPEKMAMTPLGNGDLLEHARTPFDYMDDLSLPSLQSEETRHPALDLHTSLSNNNMAVDACDVYDYSMETDAFPNMFGRGHVPQCDPLLGGVLSRPAPRPALKHYSWDRIEYDAT